MTNKNVYIQFSFTLSAANTYKYWNVIQSTTTGEKIADLLTQDQESTGWSFHYDVACSASNSSPSAVGYEGKWWVDEGVIHDDHHYLSASKTNPHKMRIAGLDDKKRYTIQISALHTASARDTWFSVDKGHTWKLHEPLNNYTDPVIFPSVKPQNGEIVIWDALNTTYGIWSAMWISEEESDVPIGPSYIRRPRTKQPPPGTPIDWANPLTKRLHAVFLPVDNSFIEVIRGLHPTTTAGTLTKTLLPGGTGPHGKTAPNINAVDFGASSNNAYLEFDFDLGFADGEAIGLAAVYGGTSAQTTASGMIITVGDSSVGSSWVSLECEVDTNDINATHYVGTFYRAQGSEAVLEGGTDKQYALVSANFRPVAANDNELEVYVDGVSTGTWNSNQYANQQNYDRVAIGRTADSTPGNPIAGSIGMCLIYKGRNLSTTEWEVLAKNPWQIFKPKEMFIGKPDDRRVVVF